MKEALKALGIFLVVMVAVFVVVFIVGFVAEGQDFILYKYFAPKQEAVRRNVFEETKSYNQGTIQELQNMQFEYAKADKDGKKALADIILHRAADYPEDKMPADLREFIQQLKRERTMGQ